MASLPSSSRSDNASISSARFFVVKLKEGNFNNVSPFVIYKSLKSSVGEVKNVKKMRSGDLLVEVASSKQADALSNCSALGLLQVSVSAHGTLNYSKGVISEPDLLHTSEKEILENLADQNVCAVRRIAIRRDGQLVPTKHIILTFSTPSIPSHLTAGYLRCGVRPYIPNPLRCFNCQRYGHSKLSCRGKLTCARCAVAGHESENCNKPARCVNCNGDHPSFFRSCPSWLAEKEVQTLKHGKGMSYAEARKLVDNRTPKQNLSYSTAIQQKKPTKSVSTQTETTAFSPFNQHVNPPSKIVNNKPTFAIKSTNATEAQIATHSNLNTSENPKKIRKRRTKPPAPKNKPEKHQSFPSRELTKKDFLKNRPIDNSSNELDDNDSIKVYVSPEEEDMLTDSTSEADAGLSSSLC